MKKYLSENSFLILMFLAILIIALLSSCKSKQQVSESVQKEVFKQNDELFILKNMRITDTLVLSVPAPETNDKKCDSLCQNEVQRLLKMLNTKKKSGNNEYGFFYDEYKKQLTAYAILDSTFSAYKNKESQQSKQDYHFEIVKIPKKYVPFWVEVLAWIGGLSILYIIIKIYPFFKKIIQ